jgi:hypothetical protein
MKFRLLDLALEDSKYEVVVEEYVWGFVVGGWLFEVVAEDGRQKTRIGLGFKETEGSRQYFPLAFGVMTSVEGSYDFPHSLFAKVAS